MVTPKVFLGLFLAGALAACSTSAPKQPAGRSESTPAHLECVPYARSISGLSIRGDAWTWWQTAAGRYRRDREPHTGAVMVLKRTERLPYGHVAVVSRVLNDREILVDHANWLNQGRVRKGLLVRDVSTGNDWSLVRVWYSPGNTLGKRSYPTYGFIHPHGDRALRLMHPPMRGPDVRTLQEALGEAGFAVSVDGVFGRETRDALLAYQTKAGLATDGIAGSRTRSRLGL